jgi:hypothetical protein
MTIVCLGWGSLVWNSDSLDLASEWSTDGPVIPVEFARQSDNGRITLVIAYGTPSVPVLWAKLAESDIEEAKRKLALREGISARNISKGVGYWTRDQASARTEARAIGKWAEERGYEGVVWTALQPRFAGMYRLPSEPEVVGYLASLTGRVRAEAETYCRRAPTQIRTPYRATIEARLGWTSEPEGQ